MDGQFRGPGAQARKVTGIVTRCDVGDKDRVATSRHYEMLVADGGRLYSAGQDCTHGQLGQVRATICK